MNTQLLQFWKRLKLSIICKFFENLLSMRRKRANDKIEEALVRGCQGEKVVCYLTVKKYG